MEHNPERKYKGYRPRQAARGATNMGVPVNYATTYLFNDSLGPHLLAVRAVSTVSSSGNLSYSSVVHGHAGAIAGVISPVVTGEATPAGQLYYIDTATVIVPDMVLTYPGTLYAGNNTMPMWILQPGWSLIVQYETAAAFQYVGFLWEAISIDELDYMT